MRLSHVVDGDGPTLVLLGSLGSDVSLWQPQVRALAGFRVVRVDLPGHGRSAVPHEAFSIRDIARAVLDLVDGEASFCGLSLGGLVAMAVAVEEPPRAERLVLACTKPYFPPPEQWAERAALVRRDGTTAIADAVLARWFSTAADASLVERARAMFVATPAEGYARCCEALRDADLQAALPRITAPTLVLSGREDPTVTPDEAAALAEAVSGARHVTIEHGAHLLSAERPEEFNRELLRHCA
jgi:3-oxoadipate enol-lactonase